MDLSLVLSARTILLTNLLMDDLSVDGPCWMDAFLSIFREDLFPGLTVSSRCGGWSGTEIPDDFLSPIVLTRVLLLCSLRAV